MEFTRLMTGQITRRLEVNPGGGALAGRPESSKHVNESRALSLVTRMTEARSGARRPPRTSSRARLLTLKRRWPAHATAADRAQAPEAAQNTALRAVGASGCLIFPPAFSSVGRRTSLPRQPRIGYEGRVMQSPAIHRSVEPYKRPTSTRWGSANDLRAFVWWFDEADPHPGRGDPPPHGASGPANGSARRDRLGKTAAAPCRSPQKGWRTTQGARLM